MTVPLRFLASGAAAGVVSAVSFTAIHQVLISRIWFALPAMAVAGAVSGLCLAWSYSLIVSRPSTGAWLKYNAAYVVVLILLGVTSLAVFEPATTIAALLAAKEPPRGLIGQALPMTGLFTLATAALLSIIYRVRWAQAGAILVTAIVVVLFLGLNISVLGLVRVPSGSLYLIAEVFALIVALAAVYALTLLALERKSFA